MQVQAGTEQTPASVRLPQLGLEAYFWPSPYYQVSLLGSFSCNDSKTGGAGDCVEAPTSTGRLLERRIMSLMLNIPTTKCYRLCHFI
jgi:hypothetical protein